MSVVAVPLETGLSGSALERLRVLTGRMEQGLLDAVADPDAASPAELELIELWRQLVLLVERAEGGDPASVRGASISPPQVRAAASCARRVSSVRALKRTPDGGAAGGVAGVVGRDAALPTTGVRPDGGWTPAQAEVRSEPFVKGVQDDTCTTDGDGAGDGGGSGGGGRCDDTGGGGSVVRARGRLGQQGVALRWRRGASAGWALVLGWLRQLVPLRSAPGAVGRQGAAPQHPAGTMRGGPDES